MRFNLTFFSVLLACVTSTALADIVEIGPDDLRIHPKEFNSGTYIPTAFPGTLALRAQSDLHAGEFAQTWYAYDEQAKGILVYVQRIDSASGELKGSPTTISPPNAATWHYIDSLSITYNTMEDEYLLMVSGALTGHNWSDCAAYGYRIDAVNGVYAPGDVVVLAEATVFGSAIIDWNSRSGSYLLSMIEWHAVPQPHNVMVQTFGADLAPLSGLTAIAEMPRWTRIQAVTAGEDFVVAWSSRPEGELSSQSNNRLVSRRISGFTGTPIAPVKTVAHSPGAIKGLDLAASGDGDTLLFLWMEDNWQSWANKGVVTDSMGVAIKEFDLGPDAPKHEADGFTRIIGTPTAIWQDHSETFLVAWPDTIRAGSSWQDYERHMMTQRFTAAGEAVDALPSGVSQPWHNGRKKVSLSQTSLAYDPANGNVLATWLDWSYSGAIAGQLLHDTDFPPTDEPVCEPGEAPLPPEFITGLWTYIEPLCDGGGVRVMVSSVRDSLHDVFLSAVASGDSEGKLEFEYTGCNPGSATCELDDFQPEGVRWVNIRVLTSEQQAPSSFRVNVAARTGSGFQQNVGQSITLPAIGAVDEESAVDGEPVDADEATGGGHAATEETVSEVPASGEDDAIDVQAVPVREQQIDESSGESATPGSSGPDSGSRDAAPSVNLAASADSDDTPASGGGASTLEWLLLTMLAAFRARRRHST